MTYLGIISMAILDRWPYYTVIQVLLYKNKEKLVIL